MWRVSGHASFVTDGQSAELLVVVVATGEGVALALVKGGGPGVERRALPSLDQTRALSRISFREAPARLVSDPGDGGSLALLLDAAALLLAAEQLGGARRCLELSVEYAKVREQFGRPIGAFQAIKHKCADMHVKVEAARSLVLYASRAAVDADHVGELSVLAPMAKAYCSDAFFEVSAETIQVHGGLGFTWEHEAHLHFKRATVSRQLFGSPNELRARMLRGLEVTA